MTLSLLAHDRLGQDLKIKVSKHVVCAWSWQLVYTMEHDEDESGFSIVFRKSHPLWELLCHHIAHLPGMLPELIESSSWFARLDDRYAVEVAQVTIPDALAQTLYLPLWEAVQGEE